MSYLAIARKWRPSTFDEIVGQGHVTRTLQNAIRLDRVHHAFLFTGARGVGKTTAARTLARALNCAQGPTPTPCGECASCVELLSGNSPDVIEIDGASNNSVEDIRDLRESVRYLPQRGRRKVYIVDEVHMLSRGAFNALLKTLEEPPAHVVFIFATTEPQKIPDTILSRVQRFDFKRIATGVVVERLALILEAEGLSIPEDGLRLIARAGEGSMRDAQSLLDQVISFAEGELTTEKVAEILGLVDRTLLYGMLEGMLQGDADRCLESIDQVYSYGYDLSQFTSEMLELLRNATMVGLSPSSKRYLDVPDDERGRLEGLADGVPSDVFVRSFQVMLDVHEQVARAPRPKLVLEMAVARLVSIRPARPVEQIVQRLGDLERRLRHGGVHVRAPGGGGSRGGGSSGPDDDEPRPGPGSPSTGSSTAPGGSAAPAAGAGRPTPPRPASPSSSPRPRPPAPRRSEPAVQRSEPSSRPAPRATPSPPPEARFAAPPPPAPRLEELSEAPAVAEETEIVEEEPVEIPPVPSAPPGAAPGEAFLVLQRWLERLGPRYSGWAFDCALDGVAPPVLRVVFGSTFTRRNAAELSRDPRLLEGVAGVFPGCTTVDARERKGERPLTRREVEAAEAAAQRAALAAEMAEHPRVKQVQEALGAELLEVCPYAEGPSLRSGR